MGEPFWFVGFFFINFVNGAVLKANLTIRFIFWANKRFKNYLVSLGYILFIYI